MSTLSVLGRTNTLLQMHFSVLIHNDHNDTSQNGTGTLNNGKFLNGILQNNTGTALQNISYKTVHSHKMVHVTKWNSYQMEQLQNGTLQNGTQDIVICYLAVHRW
jgi:hypothetical protein